MTMKKQKRAEEHNSLLNRPTMTIIVATDRRDWDCDRRERACANGIYICGTKKTYGARV